MQISFCVTHYNRFDMLINCFPSLIDDERVNDIVVMDDDSTDGSFEKLVKYYEGIEKVRVIKQFFNRKMQQNKADAIFHAKNDFVIIGDSDNVFRTSYIDALEKGYPLKNDTIYQPSFGQPQFDWRKYEGIVIDKNNVGECMEDAYFRSSLNGCNYVVNRKEYLKNYVPNTEIDAADTIFFLHNWLKAGNKYFIVPGMEYEHAVHADSGFLKNVHKNMADAIRIENEIKVLNGIM